jgi:hypothetical protein
MRQHLQELIMRRRLDLGNKSRGAITEDAERAGYPSVDRIALSRFLKTGYRVSRLDRKIVCGLAAGLETTHRAVSDAILLDMNVPLEPVDSCECGREPGDVVIRIRGGEYTEDQLQEIVRAAHEAIHQAEQNAGDGPTATSVE